MRPSSEISLKVENVGKTYLRNGKDPVEAVQDVSFEIHPGEIFGLLGPNGAGKTSLISMITTLETPTTGQIEIFGQSNQKAPQLTKLQLGVVPQEIVTQGFFNLVEILTFHSGYYGKLRNQERIDYLLHKLGLWEHRSKLVKQLSGGMKRRLMIAKALVHDPKLLLLDEPTAGVDIELRNSLWDFVQDLQKEGKAILLTTHYLQEAEALCSRIGILQKGRLVYLGATQEIIQKLAMKTVEIELKSSKKMSLSIPPNKPLGELLAELKIEASDLVHLKIKEGSLEDAFLNVVSS